MLTRWWLVVGLNQLALLWGVFALCGIETRSKLPLVWFGFSGTTTESVTVDSFVGYPIPWLWQEETIVVDSTGVIACVTERKPKGSNLAVPAVLLTLALITPPLTLGVLRRKTRTPPGLSRSTQALGVIAFASLVGLAVSLLDVIADRRSHGEDVPFAHPPGAWVKGDPLLLRQIQYLQQNYEAVAYPIAVLIGPDGSLVGTGKRFWDGRTRRTLFACAMGSIIGCLLFRPWRGSSIPRPPHGADGAFAPSA